MNTPKKYIGRIPACGVFCGGCPIYIREKNPCSGADMNWQRCEKCKTFHLCCKDKNITHCYECPTFPCRKFKNFAKRWLKYGQNFIDNQKLLKEAGTEYFINYYNSMVDNVKGYIVIENWDESYENPIRLERNEEVVIDLSTINDDREWLNWVWCISENGTAGWVPSQILKVTGSLSDQKQTAVALEYYSAYELPVNKDDLVTGARILNGWLWCRKENTDQEGWVPMRNIKVID